MRSIVFGLVALAACSGGLAQNNETLADSIRSYNDSVRWERYATAANRLPPSERTHFVEAMDERSKDIRITDYEVVTVDPHGPREARVHVKLSWYRDSEQILRETHAMQTWERHGKVWLLVDESRMRGADMPGLVDRTDPVKDEPHSPSSRL